MTFKDFKGFKKTKSIVDIYNIQKVLGEGAQGQVRLARHKRAKEYCAIKIINKN